MGTDEECGSSDIEHYYSVEKEAPMTFSPDGEFPVVNIEKGRLPGHFTAGWEKSEQLPRLVSFKAGVKTNVVPGKAHAVVEGVELEVLTATAAQMEQETGIHFEFGEESGKMHITAVGEGAHASLPHDGKNALTGLLSYLTRLPLAECGQTETLKKLLGLMPHGETDGKSLGVKMGDELSGDLTLAFSMLTVNGEGLDGEFDSRCPICANEDNVLRVIRENMANIGVTLHNETMTAPHHVDGDSHFVRTLNAAYELYTGLKGGCESMGGGTYVHDLKNGVAFGAALPGTDNRMHGADEFAVIDELMVSAKIFAQVIVDLCS